MIKQKLQAVRYFMEAVQFKGDVSPYLMAEHMKIQNKIRLSSSLKKLGYVENPAQNVWKWIGPEEITDSDVKRVFLEAQRRGNSKKKHDEQLFTNSIDHYSLSESTCIEFLKAKGYKIYKVVEQAI
jgi:hypothetical protein